MTIPLRNAFYGIVDYLAQPVGMLLAAPLLLHRIGAASYGIWVVASAAVGAGSVISSGFGDAVIQRLATLRDQGDQPQMRRVVANVMAINIALSVALSLVLWLLAPLAAMHITREAPALESACRWSLRIGAVLMIVKSAESVFISAQRAFESYQSAVRISIVVRLLTIAAAVSIAAARGSLIFIMLATLLLGAVGAIVQCNALRALLPGAPFLPILHRATLRSLAAFGGFSWLQAICGVVFSQADRLLIGATLGASAVATYGICVQVGQPIHGLTAAGLHFLFPHLSARSAHLPLSRIRSLIFKSLALNVALAATFTGIVAVTGARLLGLWLGSAVGAQAATILPLIAVSFGLLAMNVTGHYALLAAGRAGLVTSLNFVGGSVMLLTITALWRTHGIQGATFARLCYGPLTLLMYIPLSRMLSSTPGVRFSSPAITVEEA